MKRPNGAPRSHAHARVAVAVALVAAALTACGGAPPQPEPPPIVEYDSAGVHVVELPDPATVASPA